MNRAGFLLVLEGIDGAGKSTLARRLEDWCHGCGLRAVRSREPTDGPHGQTLRRTAQTGRLPPQEELTLFLEDRATHVATFIAPALARGDVAILDRYYFSTAAYQGARGLDPQAIIRVNEEFAPLPDLVLLLDLDPAFSHARIGQRGSGIDGFEGAPYLVKVRHIFLTLDRPFMHKIDATRGPDEVFAECLAHLEPALRDRGLLG